MKSIRWWWLLYGVAFVLFAACGDTSYTEIRRSVRKTQMGIRNIKGDARMAKKTVGLDGKPVAPTEDSTQAADPRLVSPMEQKNMLNQYSYLYDFINPESANKFSSANISWDSVQNIYYIKNEAKRKLNSKYEVFGWHPYWMGSAWESYSFDLLSTVAYFCYKVDPTDGSYTNPEQIREWRTTAMIDSAKAHHCRVLLTVASHGTEQNTTFLSNESAWSNLIDSVALLVNARKADGVDLNFEQVPEEYSRALLLFIEKLRSELDQKILSGHAFISASLPSFSNRTSFDVEAMHRYCDQLVIMGYAFNAGQPMTGAVSPLRSKQASAPSIVESVEYYLKHGLDPQHTVLALPYYGAQWKGTINKDGLYDTRYDKEITYREVMQLYDKQFVPQYDPVSMTNYHFMEFPDSTSVECWYDDEYTLNKKYDFALSRNFKGIGIWALGYDNGYTALWSLIDKKFTSDTIAVRDPIAEADGYPIQMGNFLLRYRDVFMIAFLFFAISVVLGLLIAFQDWRVRESVFGNQLFRYLLLLIMTILLVPLLGLLQWFGDGRWQFLIAFLLGALCLFWVMRVNISFHSDRP
jgi:spore germination protein YaaH